MHRNTLLFVPSFMFLLAATSCTYIHDSRTSSVVEIDPGEDAELLEGVTSLDHELWSHILETYASSDGVAYSELLQDGEDRFLLRQYLNLLGAVDPVGLDGQEEKVAFYINVYNATVVDLVLERLAESPGFRVDVDNFAFFDEPAANVGGKLLALNVVEHAILRGDLSHDSISVSTLDAENQQLMTALHEDIWSASGESFDPRAHFLLNCASASCPPLQTAALTAESYDEIAEAATTAFLADESRGAGSAGISQLFNWFAADFTAAGYASVSAFIGEYRSLDEVDTGTFLVYDWALNEWDRQ